MAITVFVHVRVESVHRDAWHFFNYDSVYKVKEFLKYGLPAGVMLIMEWWAYELLHIYAGWLGVDELATCIIFFSLLNI